VEVVMPAVVISFSGAFSAAVVDVVPANEVEVASLAVEVVAWTIYPEVVVVVAAAA
jgi:hypothetical protein